MPPSAPMIDIANRHSDQMSIHGRGNPVAGVLDFQAGAVINARRVVKFDTPADTVIQAAADTDAFVGVSQNDVACKLGDTVPVAVSDICYVEAGAAITQGALLSSDSVGRALTAASGDAAWGRALQTAAGAGSIIRAVFGPRAVLA